MLKHKLKTTINADGTPILDRQLTEAFKDREKLLRTLKAIYSKTKLNRKQRDKLGAIRRDIYTRKHYYFRKGMVITMSGKIRMY